MIKTLKLSIDKLQIPDGSSLVHESTSWEVSKLPDFSNVDTLILQSLQDSNNLYSYSLAYDMRKNEPLYIRTKFHFNNGKSSNWSKIVPLNPEQVGIKLSSTILVTPVVKVNVEYTNNLNGEIEITTSDMRLYGGVGNHTCTTWEIIDSDGEILFFREKDYDNLTSIKIDGSVLKENKAYFIKAKHHTDTNGNSNYGQTIITTFTGNTPLFNLYSPYTLVPNRWMYFELRLLTTEFKNIDIIITNELGDTVSSNLTQTSKIPRIYSGDLKPFHRYTIKARINLIGGSPTEYKNIVTTMIRPNQLINYNDTINYNNKQSYIQEILLNSSTTQSSNENYAGDILLGKHQDENIYSYKLINGKLVELGTAMTLDGDRKNMRKPYINFLPLHNGRMLIDYASDVVDSIYRKPVFKVYEFNPITHKFLPLHTINRDNERGSTALSASAAAMKSNILYYVPSGMVDSAGEKTELKLRRYDTVNNVMLDDIDLPINVKRHVNLIVDKNDNLFLFGGSNNSINDTTTDNPLDNIATYQRDNNGVYQFNTVSGVWTKVSEFPTSIPVSLYNFQAYLRRDEKIVLFNAVSSGPSLGNQDTYVYDPILKTFQIDTNDFSDNLQYKNSIVLKNGEVLRISSRALDPQKVYKYITNTISVEDIKDNTTIDAINDLVVPAGKTITIESPYRFNTIKVEGTNETDTGLLQWLDGDKLHEFRYNDLIITRDTTITQDLYIGIKEWDSITILEDAHLEIYNMINVPDDKSFTIDGPLILDEIIIGDNGELIINLPD